MLRALLVCVALLVAWPSAHAWPVHGNPGGVANCPQAVDVNSYCANSPGGNYQVSEASFRQNGQTWATDANWNRGGVDYKVGYYTALALLTDIAISQPSGCSFNPTGGVAGGGQPGGGPIVICSATSNLTIVGYNFFSPSLGKCVPLDIQSGQTGKVTIKDNNFKDGPDCVTNNPTGNWSYLIWLENASGADFDIESNNIDGGKDQSLFQCTSFSIIGHITIAYNAAIHCDSQPMQFTATTAPLSIDSHANFSEGFIYHINHHGEWWLFPFRPNGNGGSSSGSSGQWSSTADTLVVDSDNVNNGDTALLYGEPDNNTCRPASCSIAGYTIDHLFGVTNANAGTNTIAYLIEMGAVTFGSPGVSITNSLFDASGAIAASNFLAIGGSAPFTFSGTTNGTTTVAVTSGDPTGQAGNVLTSANNDITPGTSIVSANSTTVVLSAAATGSHAGQLITTYNTYCPTGAATLTNDKNLLTGATISTFALNNSLNASGGTC